jgi:hypothetical protein
VHVVLETDASELEQPIGHRPVHGVAVLLAATRIVEQRRDEVDPRLDHPERRSQYRDVVDWSRVDGLLEFGGIRLEDNVLVTDAGPENLTGAIPRTLAPVR